MWPHSQNAFLRTHPSDVTLLRTAIGNTHCADFSSMIALLVMLTNMHRIIRSQIAFSFDQFTKGNMVLRYWEDGYNKVKIAI